MYPLLEADLDPALTELRGLSREIATDLRSRALSVDADPFDLDGHLAAPSLALLRSASTPEPYRDVEVPAALGSYPTRCVARVLANLELARGDAGILSANTGPSLAGLVVDALGSPAQRDHFYRALSDGRTWSFFAMTEPDRGSDAAAMTTRLDRDPATGGSRLHGTKKYIANAFRAGVGVTLARTGSSALSLRAVLLDRPAPGLTAEPLDMIGLRGAGISVVRLDGVPVEPGRMLGSHLPASRRGLWAASRALNVMRVQIASQALGVAHALADLVRAERPHWAGCEPPELRLAAARAMLLGAAAALDAAPDDRRPPSAAKLHVVDLAARTSRWAARALGPGSLARNPLLEKWSRDLHAFEFMDGTSNILRLALAPEPARIREAS